MNSERMLPDDSRIDTVLAENHDDVVDEVEDVRRRALDQGLIDTDLFLAEPELLEVVSATAFCLTYIVPDSYDDYDAYQSMHRAVAFGLQLAIMMYGQSTAINAGPYLNQFVGHSARFEDMAYEIDSYMKDNPHIDGFIDEYLHELIKDEKYAYQTSLAAGMILMLAERQNAEDFIAASVEDATPADFI